ncbi:Acetyltransferase (GNAT) family protein [Streptoalloteichus tenebrarius]|uniref:Acetyltransferase (GNAT) family protein n=1 Tax=Streptoalloteichus tenebrarius (strain ATCC 17920 / DSM 40477 / JCM 4838 / CBS 697.72 / NBRC 16177 / NCIMB 11028 / NRRL B-12390 / A12253. 1 / ISP 5477) TaxID=1933 RepID=A0ABT1HQ65_STRSD|nr:GNAT family N-acetyltransferase [Streptoalloteichus tenebrarius]MCP2257648.1 Acetyltransferase (GNAT) family protein [Streptoalloteichus tenebrarius]BFE98608.1 GNAT family N-acetyltransferase [Streptoalloteichus tenebrarius]
MRSIVRLSADDFSHALPDLADLLVDTVSSGASLGFLTPFDHDTALTWWRERKPAVAQGTLTVWIATGPTGVQGTVSLARPDKANATHRAEIVKLMVHPQARGQGVGRALLTTAEQAAKDTGVTLLLLDTETGSPAEGLYTSAGWTRFGVVPRYASDPTGTLRDGSFYYKQLT